MNFTRSGQKINIIWKAKHLGIILDKHLIFKYHLENQSKLSSLKNKTLC